MTSGLILGEMVSIVMLNTVNNVASIQNGKLSTQVCIFPQTRPWSAGSVLTGVTVNLSRSYCIHVGNLRTLKYMYTYQMN